MKPDRPHLLVLTSTYPRWHGDTKPGFVHELCRRLTVTFNVTVIAPHAPGSSRTETLDGVRIRRFRYAPERFEHLAYGGGILNNLRQNPLAWVLVLPFFLSMLISAIREMRRPGTKLVHAHWIIPQGGVAVLARALSGKPLRILCTSHGSDLHDLGGNVSSVLKRLTLERVDAVTVMSKAMVPAVKGLVPCLSDVHTMPMGVDLEQVFTPDPAISRESDLLLFVGRLIRAKGVEVLIDAVGRLRKTHPAIRLEIIGDGPEKRVLENMITRLELQDNVTLTGASGAVTIADRLRRATVFVMPSIGQEGFGLVQVEAMGCGCPVISSDLPAVHDVIIHEKTGILVPPGDANALANEMQALLENNQLRTTLAANALEHVHRNFDWESAANRYGRLLEDLQRQVFATTSNRER